MIGIIGGTGLYKIEGFKEIRAHDLDTPFGKPSAKVLIGELNGREVAFLPRHGSQHHFLPSEINFRANLWALKAAGVRRIISVSAVGSLRGEIKPGDLVTPSQYFDWTRGKRVSTFFGNGLVAHVSTAEPTCAKLREVIESSTDGTLHTEKTYACVEGPRLGTRAESLFLRQVGCDIVGMTNVPEVFLAREAQLCYATVAIATDYDCWLEDPKQHASVDKVIELYTKNLGKVRDLIARVVSSTAPLVECACRRSLDSAVMSREETLSEEQRALLTVLRQ